MDAVQLLVSLLNLKFICSKSGRSCHAGSTRRCASSGCLQPIPLLICSTEEWEKIRLQARPRLYNTLVTTVASRPSSLWSPPTDFASHPLISPRCPLTRHSHHHCILQQSTCRLGLLLYYVSDYRYHDGLGTVSVYFIFLYYYFGLTQAITAALKSLWQC